MIAQSELTGRRCGWSLLEVFFVAALVTYSRFIEYGRPRVWMREDHVFRVVPRYLHRGESLAMVRLVSFNAG